MYNKSILIGRLVADPELKTTPNGVSVATFRIAVDRPYKRRIATTALSLWRQMIITICRSDF